MMLRALGLMSGTSLDGVDIAMLDTDGETIAAFGPTGYRPYSAAERGLLLRALTEAEALTDRTARPGVLAEAEGLITTAHAEMVAEFLRDNGLRRERIDLVGFHGQTVLHRPARRLTVQIGDGEALAQRIGIAVVYDFRAADVAAGGQGAPLAPIFHQALARSVDRPHPIAVLNIGGVANVTYIDGDLLIAADTGPGNALIDDFMRASTGEPFDRDGETAAQGHVDEAFIAHALSHPFFTKPLPKSLDRNAFADLVLPPLSVPDSAATLAALTAASVARIVARLPRPPRSWIVSGGGARNPTLMRMLGERLHPAQVETAHALGWSPDAIEAQAFAFMAVRSLRALPITFATTTGAPKPLSGGALARVGLASGSSPGQECARG